MDGLSPLSVREEGGGRFVEGSPGLALMRTADDAGLLVEACYSNRASAALLYATNLSPNFFDLSSGEAGAILQKLRTYRIRLAVVCPPDGARLSSRFGEMAAEEKRTGYFGLFESASEAQAWLAAA